MTQATAEGTTFSWLTGLLAEANEGVSEEQFEKCLKSLDAVADGEKAYELPREVANLKIYAGKLMADLEEQGRRHIANHIVGLDKEDDHSCEVFHTDVSWKARKADLLKNLFWLGVWEYLGKPSKNFLLKSKDNVMVAVEYNRKNDLDGEGNTEDPLRDLFRGGALVIEGGLDLLSRLFR